MVQPVPMTDAIAVAGQLYRGDYADLARQGFRTIVNNRPDGEDPDQMPAAEARAVAESHGLVYHHVPMTSATLTPEVVAAFADVCRTAPRPILAHCRSGMRSCVLWALAEAAGDPQSIDRVIAAAARGGYDIAHLRGLLADYAARAAR